MKVFRRSSRYSTLALVLALVAALVAIPLSPALAEQDEARARRLLEAGEILPLERIRDLALEVRSGTLIDSELEWDNGRWVYELEVLDAQGRVWDLELDARSGELLDLELDD